MVKNCFYFFFILLSLVSLASYGAYNLLPAKAIFELLILLSVGLVAKRMQVRSWLIFYCCIIYVFYTLFIAWSNGIHLKDYFVAKDYVGVT